LNSRALAGIPSALVLLLALAACSPNRDDSEFFSPARVDVLVIDAVLIVDRPLPVLRLSRTISPEAPYAADETGESGASILIRDEAGNVTTYVGAAGGEGFYVPVIGLPPVVQPATRYELRVETTRDEILTAVTRTPGPIPVQRWVALDPGNGQEIGTLRTFAELGEGVYDAPENQLPYASVIVETRLGQSAVDGFQLTLISLDLDADFVIDPAFFEDEDFAEIERAGSSPILAAENGAVRLPWFSIFFEGRHLYKIFAVDRNWFDLIRSTPEFNGGFGQGGALGDGFEVPLFNVEGGIGLFGSASVDSIGFRVLPQE